jgi:hypothetical protein
VSPADLHRHLKPWIPTAMAEAYLLALVRKIRRESTTTTTKITLPTGTVTVAELTQVLRALNLNPQK